MELVSGPSHFCQAKNSGKISIAFIGAAVTLTGSVNSELMKQALAKVGNPNILVNMISRRVRQLTSGGGANSRPLIADTGNMGAADIALTEFIEEKIGWELLESAEEESAPSPKKRRRS